MLFENLGEPSILDKCAEKVLIFPLDISFFTLVKNGLLQSGDSVGDYHVPIWSRLIKHRQLPTAAREFLLLSMVGMILFVLRVCLEQNVAHKLHAEAITRCKYEMIFRFPFDGAYGVWTGKFKLAL